MSRAKQREQEERGHALDRAGAPPQEGANDDCRAHDHHGDLRDRRARELGAALGSEGDAREGGAEYQRESSSCDGRRTGHARPESLTEAGPARAPARARGARSGRSPARGCSRRISARSSGSGTSLAAPPRLKNPLLSGSRLVPPTSSLGFSPLAARAARSACVVGLRARFAGRVGRADSRAAGAAAAVRPALDGVADDLAAVGVLLEVRRDVVAGAPEVGVRVFAVEVAVASAVAHHLIGASEGRGGQRQPRQRSKNQQVSYYSVQSSGSPPESNIVPCSRAAKRL